MHQLSEQQSDRAPHSSETEQDPATQIDSIEDIESSSIGDPSRSRQRIDEILEEVSSLDGALQCKSLDATGEQEYSAFAFNAAEADLGMDTELAPIDITHEVSLPSWMTASRRGFASFSPYDGDFNEFFQAGVLMSLGLGPITGVVGAGLAAEIATGFGVLASNINLYEVIGGVTGALLPAAFIMGGPLVIQGAVHLWNKIFD